ncbi:hypothetical protein GCM10010193_27160 [Kitasatospora atroaurantiaca]|uniref:Nitrite reductase/ring-hydroxylating ferredoxin subunit n=2 Tax=Kitasatospora atroaurantiaca TaxID=285545 RepID=A0A561EK30_9ACTN|nr:nitrite reductase/ring-hydroxylating ferredoxin subunit [Kitasatospora atroaurantiaca]
MHIPDHPLWRQLRAAMDAPAGWQQLDGASDAVQRAVRALPLRPPARDLLHGRQLGHPLHPALVLVPAGCWLAAGLLDLTGGDARAARRLIGIGLLGAGPAALAGWVDWADLTPPQRRTGLVHALSNTSAVLLYSGSLLARTGGREVRGRALGLAGLLAVSGGAALGGHLAYRHAVGVNHAEAVPRLVPAGWHSLGPVDDFPPGETTRRMVGEVPVLVVRTESGCRVLADRCNHLSGSLSEGTLVDGCVRCPLHGSTFRLKDGAVVRGPATAPQPAFETRVTSGALEVRLPG